MTTALETIQTTINDHPIVLFMKGTPEEPQCGFSYQVVQCLRALGQDSFFAVNVLDDDEIRQGIKDFSDWPTIPQLYVNKTFIGGCDVVTELYENGELESLLKTA